MLRDTNAASWRPFAGDPEDIPTQRLTKGAALSNSRLCIAQARPSAGRLDLFHERKTICP